MEKKNKGFTLIELICGIAIMSIVTVSISIFFNSTLKLNNTQSDKLNVQLSVTTIQRTMQSSITKANKVVDSSYSTALNRYIFVGTNMDQNNEYCRLMGYKPLLYTESVNKGKAYYAYNAVKGEVRKVTIPDDTSTSSVIQYYTDSLNYDDSTKTNTWYPIATTDVSTFAAKTYDIASSLIILQGLTISYDSTNDSVVNPVIFNSFSIIGGFTTKNSSGVILNRFAVFKSNTINSDGTYPWFYIPIKPETLIYYTKTIDTVLGSYIVKNGSADGIIVTNKLTDMDEGSLRGYYDISLDAKKNAISKHFVFRVAVVDHGGNSQ